jgi:hypothetical protein
VNPLSEMVANQSVKKNYELERSLQDWRHNKSRLLQKTQNLPVLEEENGARVAIGTQEGNRMTLVSSQVERIYRLDIRMDITHRTIRVEGYVSWISERPSRVCEGCHEFAT